MIWTIILLAGGVLLALAIVITFVLGWANHALAVEVDPRVEKVNKALPGANCGGCGYVGCNEYAEAVVAGDGEVAVTLCPVGGSDCAEKIAEILGLEVTQHAPYRPAVHCGATCQQKLGRNEYNGEKTCSAANLISGVQGCIYGCLGFGDCEAVCDYDAIHIIDGKTVVDYEKCIGCGACERVCPRKVISMVPFKGEQMYVVACSNKDFGKDVKAVCTAGCIGCKACVRAANGLFEVKDNLAVVDYDKYDPAEIEAIMKAVLDKCPMKNLVKIGKPRQRDLEKVKDEKMPDVVTSKFETTVDKTEWHG